MRWYRPPKNKQRPAFVRFKMLHSRDVERVIARRVNVDHFHNEICHRAPDQREGRCDGRIELRIPSSLRPAK